MSGTLTTTDTAADANPRRLLSMTTPLGESGLVPVLLDGTEAISRGFDYTIEAMTQASDEAVRGLLGRPITIWMHDDTADHRRPIHGHIRALTRINSNVRGWRRWRVEMVPWFWFLTHSVDCRIFQHLSIPEILRTLFTEYRLSAFEFRLQASYPKLEFCVQYRESAHDFASRLMEHAGIFYWFEHHADRHLMVLADRNEMAPIAEPREVAMEQRAAAGSISELSQRYECRPANWVLKDFDFTAPTKELLAETPTILRVEPMRGLEMFDYPGGYTGIDDGKTMTRLRMEHEEARHCSVRGEGTRADFTAGQRFWVAANEQAGQDQAAGFLLIEVRHRATDDSGFFATTAKPEEYHNEFTAIPVQTLFRPDRRTARPVVQGPQTATVVGPVGENIYTDAYGRVRVLFHWDRRGKRDEKASCWIRVSQHAAGSGWGSVAIPHVGQEVVVSFLEGDPDRPLVTGRVHNGSHEPPLKLPADKNKTIIRDHGDNKIIMHGKPGRQWLSAVSPRAVNLVAMRSAAKPLSADMTIDGVDFDNSQDEDGFKDLYRLWGELSASPAPQTASGTSFDPSAAYTVDPSGADEANAASVNMLTEGHLNSLSISNTNNWVGVDMNTWVKNNVHNHVCEWQFDYYKYHQEFTPVLHVEETGMHQEVTALHTEETVMHAEATGVHIESHDGFHFEQEWGFHMKVGDMQELNTKFQQIDTIDDHVKINQSATEMSDVHNYIHITKTELAEEIAINTAIFLLQASGNCTLMGSSISLNGDSSVSVSGISFMVTAAIISLA